MFCKFCGAQVDENATFCQKCGGRVTSNKISPTVSYDNNTMPNTKSVTGSYITEASFNPSGMIALIVLEVILLTFSIIFLSIVNSVPPYDNLFKVCSKATWNMLLIICIISYTIAIICYTITIAISSDIKCIVYEKRLVGKAVNSRFSVSKVNFSLSYDEIDNVTVKKRIITITSNGVPYIVAASSVDQAEKVAHWINEKRNGKDISYQAENIWKCPKCGIKNKDVQRCKLCGTPFSYTNTENIASQNTWQCPNCGQTNSSYVGTCGCGTRKP